MDYRQYYDLKKGTKYQLLRFLMRNTNKAFRKDHGLVGNLERVARRFNKRQLLELFSTYYFLLVTVLSDRTLVLCVSRDTKLHELKRLVIQFGGSPGTPTDTESFRFTDTCNMFRNLRSERNIFSDSQTMGEIGYGDGGYLYVEYLETGFIPDVIMCMG